ncbi:hypothetical protein [Aurantibacillus circumpalustris]|uniref:hypothetical protein n=1 Tax=Aurantibacillus circumpalustris TaxID=3036359 RepID=UPI00295C3010|nr:hypothetical protein [Aurantibacillus circumpalustris]
MKIFFITVSFAVATFSASAQNNLYQNIKKLINETHSEISTENKLIAFNIWSLDNLESRETNKQFEKAYSVYESSFLKGGRNGLIVVSINKNNLSSPALVTYAKDGITKTIPFKLSDFEDLDTSITNAVFDSNGGGVYQNLSSQNVLGSIHHLITR